MSCLNQMVVRCGRFGPGSHYHPWETGRPRRFVTRSELRWGTLGLGPFREESRKIGAKISGGHYGICQRIGTHALANTIVATDSSRELVITVPLPQDWGQRVDSRPKTRRFRSHWLELGRRLRDFRARYRVTQAEMAEAVGGAGHSAVAQWERGTNVPEGVRRERLVELLDGHLWPELRAAAIGGEGNWPATS